MRYTNFEIYCPKSQTVEYSAKTISAIKRYIDKHHIEHTLEGSGRVIRLERNKEYKIVSIWEFYNGTFNKTIQQAPFAVEYRHSRYVNVGLP